MTKLRIDEGLFKVDLAPLERYVSWSPGARYFNLPPGKEHYKLLAYLASQLPPGSAVADCGTLYGCSAAALASNPNVEVETYDIADHIPTGLRESIWTMDNVRPRLANCTEDTWVKVIAYQSSLVLLDVDPHDGAQESFFFMRLLEEKFQGVLICDDINLNDNMKRFWRALGGPVRPVDLTPWGHWSGTGAVVFDPSVIDLEVTL